MRKRLSRLMSMGLLALLAACGGGGGGGSGSPPAGADATPDTFTFADQGGTARSAQVDSDEVVISGISTPVPISISGGEYSIDGGPFTSAAGTVSNNQRVRVRATTSDQFSTPVRVVLTIGGVSAAFTVVTADPDSTPDAFELRTIVNATRGSAVTSSGVTITGIDVPAPISIENGEYAIDGGAFTSEAGSISAGQSLTVRVQASTNYSKVTRARVTIGGVASDFEVLSEVPNYLPDDVAFDGQDVVYLLNNSYRLVFRWSISEARYLDAYVIGATGSTARKMAYSAEHQRLYVGYSTGSIQYIDVTSGAGAETAFASTATGVTGLAAAGSYLVAQTGSSGWVTHSLLDSSGAVTHQQEGYRYSRDLAWDPVTSRLYYFRDGSSPNDLHYSVIDQATGRFGSQNETPYHGAYLIQAPIRVSVNGQYVLLGSGDIYNRSDLTWSGSLGAQVTDARWFADGSLVTLATAGNQTTLRRLGTNLATVEQLTYTGQALRVLGTDTRMAVLVINNSTVGFHVYEPNDDSDGDGVSNTEDAFPLDPAASVDTDRDGYPDAWNARSDQGDSTTGLSLDAYPQDSACYLPAHGDGVNCDYSATLPNYVPDQVLQHGDTVYLLSTANRRVYRWSIATGAYLNPYVVGLNQGFATIAPTRMTYSADHQRLYLGYGTGAIRYIDVSSGSAAEVPFANTAMAVSGLAAVGNYVLAQDGSGAWGTHYVFARSGAVTDQEDWNYYSREYAWDPVNSRVYFFRDGTSPNDLHYEVIDQATGQITAEGETPYHGDYLIQPPIRVSASGQYVLLGSGNIYDQAGLTWSGSLGTQVTDARWFANGSLVTLTTASNQTTLRRLGTNLTTMEQRTYTGQALRVVGSDTRMAVLVINNGTVGFHTYVPADDSDNDGVINTADAFPLDPAASVDSDRDGYPDAWNAGRDQDDSTTGLSLDAYPQDSACYLAAHGDGVNCDYSATLPDYVPDQVVQQGDIVYLLSSANRRVYRWSMTTETYLNPYVVGINQGFSVIAPTRMAYSSEHERLYLGYGTGAIQYIDVSSGSVVEVPFANTAAAVNGLAAIGDYLLAQDNGSWATHYVIDSNGVITDQASGYRYSRELAWDPVNSRLYFFRDGISPNDLNYAGIDQATGQFTTSGETPYHGDYLIQPPIRVSADGQYILLGSGDLYDQAGLTWSGSLGTQVTDARWFANGSLVALTTASNQTTLRRLGANSSTTLATLEQLTYSGQALRVVGSDARMAVLVINNGTVGFHMYVPNDDSDGDGVPNTDDAFPLDPAASVDSDRDGYPDAWNAGSDQDDSTTGLSLDAYPQDAACYLSSHGDGVTCNYGATVPNYVPDQVIYDGDTVYLLSSANHRVYRWSLATQSYLNPYVVGINQGFGTIAPTRMAYSSSHQRLYLGYSTGAIQYIDVGSGNVVEVALANTAMAVNGLAAVGNYLLAQDYSGAWATHYVIDSNGAITDREEWNHYSREYAWDPVNSRVYFFRDGTSPNDLHYEVIDQATGQITAEGETPYHGDYLIQPPIRVSASGQYVLLGSGNIYDQAGLTWSGSLGTQVTDARWFADGSLVALTTASNQTTLRRLGANSTSNLATLEQLTYSGQALRVVGSDTRMAVLVINNGTVGFHIYEPNDDSDGDGVPNTDDAFPLDPAASVDTDRDGYPDAWNAGSSQDDSTTGLSLDAYPQDSACYLPAHGDGVNCNYSATVPNYVPDQVINHGDTVYLLSSANRRVYRWSIATGTYLNPYVVGIDQGFSSLAPSKMAYSGAHERLYLGYSTGAIQYIDVSSGSAVEVPFANTAGAVNGLAAVGNYLLAQDNGSWATHYVIDSNGVITDQESGYRYSRELTWDPVHSRLYFFRDGLSPNDLNYAVIEQVTGQFTTSGETPYHGDYPIQPPIRVSTDGRYILLGSGDLYNQAGLTWSGSLGRAIADAHWLDSLIVDVDTTDRVEIRDADTRTVLRSYQYLGQPLRLVFGQEQAYLVHVMNGTTAFVRLAFGDQDQDSMPQWWEDLYGLDDGNDADALGDLDGDGVSNETEYLHRSNPLVVDTDGDGLTDQEEIVTHATNPARADSEGDGLNDADEVLTHGTDPWNRDSDGDGYTDFDEVLYGGNPTDPTGVPQPLVSYNQSFENDPDLAAWTTPQGTAPWTIDATTAYSGAASLKFGTTTTQAGSVRFRGFFSPGQLSFYARVDSASCCDRLEVFINGSQVLYLYPSNQWTRYTVPVTLGVHEIEWRHRPDGYGADAAWIDDVAFAGQ